MKITCQSCQSKYTVSDEKVQGKTVKIKCRKCGATILVNSGGVTTSGAGLADPVSLSTGGNTDGGGTYLVNVADGDQRSMTLVEIETESAPPAALVVAPLLLTRIVAPHLRHLILTVFPWTFSSETVYFD